jgi:hypothetical protein
MHGHILSHQLNAQTMNQRTPKQTIRIANSKTTPSTTPLYQHQLLTTPLNNTIVSTPRITYIIPTSFNQQHNRL